MGFGSGAVAVDQPSLLEDCGLLKLVLLVRKN